MSQSISNMLGMSLILKPYETKGNHVINYLEGGRHGRQNPSKIFGYPVDKGMCVIGSTVFLYDGLQVAVIWAIHRPSNKNTVPPPSKIPSCSARIKLVWKPGGHGYLFGKFQCHRG